MLEEKLTNKKNNQKNKSKADLLSLGSADLSLPHDARPASRPRAGYWMKWNSFLLVFGGLAGAQSGFCSHIISFWVKMNFGHFPGNVISTKAIQQSRYQTSKKESKHRLIYDERFLAHIFGKGVGAKLASQNVHLLCIAEVS